MPKQPPFDAALLERLPGVLAIPLHEFAAANLAELRLHRPCDAIEILTRFCTVLAVAEVRLPAEPRKLPDQLVKELGPSILTPTFARWLGMAKGLADFLAGERSNPLVLPELPRFIRDVLLQTAPHDNRYLESSILELRNTLAHGGRLTGAMAEYLLLGDASGHFQGLLSSLPAELAAEEDDEVPARPAEGGPAPGGTTFRGWETVLGEVVTGLAALLGGSPLCSFDGEAARDLTGLQPSGDLAAGRGLAGHRGGAGAGRAGRGGPADCPRHLVSPRPGRRPRGYRGGLPRCQPGPSGARTPDRGPASNERPSQREGARRILSGSGLLPGPSSSPGTSRRHRALDSG
jgi:hypothetical protein